MSIISVRISTDSNHHRTSVVSSVDQVRLPTWRRQLRSKVFRTTLLVVVTVINYNKHLPLYLYI